MFDAQLEVALKGELAPTANPLSSDAVLAALADVAVKRIKESADAATAAFRAFIRVWQGGATPAAFGETCQP